MIDLQATLDTALAAELSPLNAQIATLQASLATAQAALAAAQAQVAPLTAQVASLQAQVADLQAQLAAIQPPVPTAWNTGYRGGVSNLTISAPITADNTLIENKNVTIVGTLAVTGANFTIRNCIVNYGGALGIDGQNGPITVDSCSIRPAAGAGPSVRGSGLIKGTKVDITPTGGGGFYLLGPSIVRDNYLWDAAAGFNFTPFMGNLAGSTITNNTVA